MSGLPLSAARVTRPPDWPPAQPWATCTTSSCHWGYMAASAEISAKFMKTWNAYQQEVIEAHKTSDLSDSQPTKGNIAGGLTTIEEKALGNLEKIGKTIKYIDVLEPAEAPAKGAGLYFMDTSSAAAECCTLQASSGDLGDLYSSPKRHSCSKRI